MASSVAAPTGVMVGHPKARYTRVATLGLLLMAATPALFIAGGLVAGMDLSEMIGFFGIAIAVGLIAAAAVWRFGLVGRIVGIVASVLMAGVLFWLALGLAHVSSFLDVTGAVMFLTGFVLALGGGIAALVAHRRGHVATEATAGETRIMRVALALVLVAMVVSGVTTLAFRDAVDASAAAAATPIGMQDFKFAQETYEGAAGETQLVVHNSDAFMHDFAIPSLGIEPVQLPPGGEALITVNGDAGSYAMYCTLHSEDTSKAVPGEHDMGALLTLK